MINNGRELPLKIAVPAESDDLAGKLIGSVQDKKTANTINGAKAYTKEMKAAIVGTASDTASDLTLHGLKAYIDTKTKKQDEK